jgi:hypothetical protein
MISDKMIEQEILNKGLTEKRITVDDINSNIEKEVYFTAEEAYCGALELSNRVETVTKQLSTLTFCILILKNGFLVTGESACASPENFDAEIGRKIARNNAVQKIWSLMGYELRTQIYNKNNT